MDNRLPVEMHITIASATEAIEYWLQNVVLKNGVKVEKVSFTERDHFKIKFDREFSKSAKS